MIITTIDKHYYDELVGYKKSDEDTKQLATVMALWKMSHTVINAMDPSIEGDMAFLSLYYYIKMPVAVRRAWLPMLTKGAIINAIINEKLDVERYEKWLSDEIYNKLVSLTKSENERKGSEVIVGMSHECVEAMIETYAGVSLTVPDSYESEIKTPNYTYRISPRKPLYNIPELLLDGTVELDFTHEETIQTAMTLYAKKLISYPKTIQNTIPYEVWKQMKKNKQVLIYNSKWGKKVKGNKFLSRRHNFRNGESEFNGHGIVTTGLHPTDLTHKEEKLYNMIVKRVLDAFIPAKSKRNSKAKKNKNS